MPARAVVGVPLFLVGEYVGLRRPFGYGLGQPGDEAVLRDGRLQKQHRIVRRRVPKVDLRETRERAAEQRRVDRPHVFEEIACFDAAERGRKRHDRIVQREGIRLGLSGLKCAVPLWFSTYPMALLRTSTSASLTDPSPESLIVKT